MLSPKKQNIFPREIYFVFQHIFFSQVRHSFLSSTNVNTTHSHCFAHHFFFGIRKSRGSGIVYVQFSGVGFYSNMPKKINSEIPKYFTLATVSKFFSTPYPLPETISEHFYFAHLNTTASVQQRNNFLRHFKKPHRTFRKRSFMSPHHSWSSTIHHLVSQ